MRFLHPRVKLTKFSSQRIHPVFYHAVHFSQRGTHREELQEQLSIMKYLALLLVALMAMVPLAKGADADASLRGAEQENNAAPRPRLLKSHSHSGKGKVRIEKTECDILTR